MNHTGDAIGMTYLITLISGLAGGLAVPATKTAVSVLLGLGVLHIVVVLLLAASFSYDQATLKDVLMLKANEAGDIHGLYLVSAAGYICVVGSIVVGIRHVLRRHKKPAT